MDSARELHSCLKITISFSGRMPCSRASLATFFRRFANSGVGRSGRLSCSVNAVRNSFMVLSESELTALERMVSLTFSLIPRGWSFVQKYLSGTARAPENLYGRFDLMWSSEVGGRGPSTRERPMEGRLLQVFFGLPRALLTLGFAIGAGLLSFSLRWRLSASCTRSSSTRFF